MDHIPTKIDLNDLASLLFRCISHSCLLMEQFCNYHHISWKDPDNPVTEVDFLLQLYLTSAVRQHFGEGVINIIGEEDLSFASTPELKTVVDERCSNLEQCALHMLHPGIAFTQEYEAKDLNIWIDPIDCTAGFTNKRLYQVTILVGISYKGKPICGFIAHPYKRITDQDYFDPTVVIGSPQLPHQCSYEYHIPSKNWSILKRPQGQYSKKIMISSRCICQQQEHLMEAMKLQPIKEGGCGYKCLQVIKNQATSVLLVNLTCSKWDTCAAEAIIRSMGGFVIKPNLEAIDYANTTATSNKEGFFMTTSQGIFQRFLDVVQHCHKID